MTKQKQHFFIIPLFFSLFFTGLAYSQYSVNATGGDSDVTGTDGKVAYSIGQVVYTTNTSNDGSVAEGVQQVFEISTLSVKETELNVVLTAFPNPTTNHLTLQINDYNNEELSYRLFDMRGRRLSQGNIASRETRIDMNRLPSAIYLVNVLNQDNRKVKSFKIIKNNNP